MIKPDSNGWLEVSESLPQKGITQEVYCQKDGKPGPSIKFPYHFAHFNKDGEWIDAHSPHVRLRWVTHYRPIFGPILGPHYE